LISTDPSASLSTPPFLFYLSGSLVSYVFASKIAHVKASVDRMICVSIAFVMLTSTYHVTIIIVTLMTAWTGGLVFADQYDTQERRWKFEKLSIVSKRSKISYTHIH
jgi:hypothetical protein